MSSRWAVGEKESAASEERLLRYVAVAPSCTHIDSMVHLFLQEAALL